MRPSEKGVCQRQTPLFFTHTYAFFMVHLTIDLRHFIVIVVLHLLVCARRHVLAGNRSCTAYTT